MRTRNKTLRNENLLVGETKDKILNELESGWRIMEKNTIILEQASDCNANSLKSYFDVKRKIFSRLYNSTSEIIEDIKSLLETTEIHLTTMMKRMKDTRYPIRKIAKPMRDITFQFRKIQRYLGIFLAYLQQDELTMNIKDISLFYR